MVSGLISNGSVPSRMPSIARSRVSVYGLLRKSVETSQAGNRAGGTRLVFSGGIAGPNDVRLATWGSCRRAVFLFYFILFYIHTSQTTMNSSY